MKKQLQLLFILILAVFALPMTGNSQTINESFSGTFPPTGWTLVTGSGNWASSTQTADHTSGTGNFALYDAYNISGNSPSMMITPTMAISNSMKTFSFWTNYYFINGSWGSAAALYVDVLNSSGSVLATSANNLISGKNGLGWFQTTLDLSNYLSTNFTDSTIKIRFRAISDYGSYNIGIDDIFFGAAITCPAPISQIITSLTSTSAQLNWKSGGATNFKVEYGLSGFSHGTGTIYTVVTDTFKAISGLTSNTAYQWYVLDSCGVGDVSIWLGPNNFSTPCNSINIFPYSESFQSSNIPSCWTNDPTDAGGQWSFATTNTHGASADHTSGYGYYALLNDYNVYSSSSPFNLLTPPLDLSSVGKIYKLKYWAWIGANGATNPIHIDISTNGGSTWTNDVFIHDHSITNTWNEFTIPLSSYNTNNVIIRFRAISIYGFGTDNSGIDDISVEEVLLNDAGITQVLNTPSCGGSSPVMVTLQNFGVDTLFSDSVKWSVNGVNQQTYNWTGSLATNQSQTFSIGNFNFVDGTTYNIISFSTSPNGQTDQNLNNDTSSLGGYVTSMNGVYTINKNIPTLGQNFTSFADAITSLTSRGICGSVIFNVANGTYSEHVLIPAINGTSDTNTITITSASGNADDVVLTSAAIGTGDNYTLKLNGADYFHIKNMTISATNTNYATVVEVINGATHNLFYGNKILSTGTSSYNMPVRDYTTLNNYNTYRKNIMSGGYYGMYVYGVSSASWEKGTVIDSNDISGFYYYGLLSYYQDSIQITHNYIHDPSYGYYGLYTYYNFNGFNFSNNKIVMNGTSSTSYAMRVYYCNYYSYAGTSAAGLVSNNFITTLTVNGYGLYAYYSDNVKYYHNTVNVTSGTSGYALYQYNTTSNTHGDVFKNNIFKNTNGSYAAYFNTTASVVASDYNDYYVTGANLAYWGGAKATLAALQLASSKDSNSVSINPEFNSNTDMHTLSIPFNNLGTPIAAVTTDIDGESRSATNPDMGADEFTPPMNDIAIIQAISPSGTSAPIGTKIPITIKVANYGGANQSYIPIVWSQNGGNTLFYDTIAVTLNSLDTVTITLTDSMYFNSFGVYNIGIVANLYNDENRINDSLLFELMACSTLSGVYTVGGAGADFSSISQAALALSSCGINGPVTFSIASGIYHEQIEIQAVAGASVTNTITFQSTTGNRNDVQMEFNPTAIKNYIVWLNGADHILFKNMSFNSANSGSTSRIFYLSSHADTNVVFGCNLKGSYGSSIGNVLIYAYLDLNDGNLFENNNMQDCYTASYWYGQSTTMLAKNNTFKNNQITNYYYYGLFFYYHDGAKIIGNSISGSATYGLYLYYCDNNTVISKNDIQNAGSYGIRLYYCDGINSSRLEISNNFISKATSYGIYDSYTKYHSIYNNSINVTGNYGLYLYNSSATYSGHTIYNNNFVNTGTGYAAYIYSAVNLDSADYNNYYSTGSNFVYFGASYANLASLKAGNATKNQHAVSMNPGYFSSSDLHVLTQSFDNLGSPYIPIIDDIDGDARSATTPDMGADEFTFYSNDVLATNISGPTNTYCGSTLDSIYVNVGNVGNVTQDTVPVIAILTAPYGTITLTDTIFNLVGQTSSTIFIGTVNSTTTGIYHIKAYSNLNLDANHSNDTINSQFETFSFVANLPFQENFNNWPPANWIMNGGDYNWISYNNISAKADFWNIISGNLIMQTPPISIDSNSQPILKFSYSYATSSYSDSLDIQISSCGNPWVSLWKKGGDNMESNDGAGNTNPGSYKNELVNIPNAYLGQNVMIRFVGTSDYGPDLFIDNVLVAEPPVVDLGNDTTICANTTLQFDAGSGSNYAYYWRTLSSGLPISTSEFYTAEYANTYIVTVTDQNTGLSTNDTITLQHFAIPSVSLTGSATICNTDSAQLNMNFTGASPWNFSYSENNNTPINVSGTTSPLTMYFSPNTSTSYIITTITDANGCTLNANSDTAIITVNPLPTVSLSVLSDVCANATPFALSGGSPATGTYTGNGVIGTNFSAPIAGVGSHTITYKYTDGNNCTDSAQQIQVVNPVPIAAISVGINPVVYGFSTTLSGNASNGIGTYIYNWSPANYINGATNIQNTNTTGLMANTLYTLSVIDSTSTTTCQDTAQFLEYISGGPLSAAPYSNHDTICKLDTVSLFANSSGGGSSHTYSWTSFPTGFTSNIANPIAVVSENTWYIVTINDGANTGIDSIKVSTWDLPTASIIAYDTICYQDTIQLNYTFTGKSPYNFSFSTGTINGGSTGPYSNITSPWQVEFSPQLTTNYSISQLGDANGCKSYNIVNTEIFVNALPTVVYTGSDTVCFGDSILATATFTGESPFSYTYNGNTINNINATSNSMYFKPTVSTQYTITNVTDNNGCAINGNLSNIIVGINSLPTYTTGPFDTICYGQSATLSTNLTGASPWNFTINISGYLLADTSSIAQFTRTDSPTLKTVYKIVALTDGNGCSMNSSLNTDSVEIFVNALPTPTFTGLAAAYCVDAAAATLTPSPVGGTFTGAGISGSTFTPATATAGLRTVTYTYTDGNGCTNTSTNSTVVNALPTPTFTGLAAAYCVDAAAATLTPSPVGGTFTGAGISGSTFSPATATTGSYTITYSYTDGNSCVNTATHSTVVNALPVIGVPTLAAKCISEPTFALTGATPNGGTWSGNGVTNNHFNANTAGAANHTLTYTYTDGNGCVNFATTTQLVNALPVLTINGFASAYCFNGADDTLTGLPAGGTFAGTGISGNIFSPASTSVGTVSIIYFYTDANGCFNSTNSMTNINPFHTPDFTGLAATYCVNNNASVLTPDVSGGVFSGTGISGSNFNPTTAGVGTYSITYTYSNSYGCVDSKSYSTTVLGLPTVSMSGLSANYCTNAVGDTLFGTPTGGSFTGAISNGNMFDPSTAQVNSTNAVTYSFTDASGCSNTASMSAYVWALPTISMSANQTACEGSTVTVDAGTNSTHHYLWSTGDITHSISVDTSLFGLGTHAYSVMVTDTVSGCSTNGSSNVTFEAYPIIPIPDTFNICGYNPVYATAGNNPNYAYLWSNGSTSASIIIDSTMTNGNYTKFSVVVSSPAGCSVSKNFWVKFRPESNVNLGKDTTMCITGTMVLNAGSGYNYLWSNGATTQTISIVGDTVGVGLFHYSVTVERFGCVATDDINIMVNPCLGIDNYEGDFALGIYPNPTKGDFTLNIMGNTASTYNYSILNISGQMIFNGVIETNGSSEFTRNFDMRTQAKGVYFIKIQNDKVVKTEKIIIQ